MRRKWLDDWIDARKDDDHVLILKYSECRKHKSVRAIRLNRKSTELSFIAKLTGVHRAVFASARENQRLQN